jgi:drug/metabolite transporter (DMT)-like permease
MSTLNLYLVAILIWGSTWLAIKFQLGVVPPAVSIVWRFALSAVILLAYAKWKKLDLGFSARDHFFIALQGVFMFGMSYVCVYVSEEYLASGLVAVAFSIIVFWNILLMRVFFGRPINPVAVLAALLGVAGIGLVFLPELTSFSGASAGWFGLALSIIGTLIASLGSMAATRNHMHHMPIVQVNGFAMLYGALSVAIYAVLTGDRFSFDWTPAYIFSLFYLALFGSVLAFGAYLTLLKRIGADRAGYAGVAVPIVALFLSTFAENLHWQAAMIAGVILCVGGNVLMLRGTGASAALPAEESPRG